MNNAEQMIAEGALVVVNHSGGKDSQAMLIRLRQMGVPEDQMVVIHADLGGIEWAGTVDHIKATIGDLPLIVCQAATGWWDMVERRQMWPSPKNRQCTSDLKRTPIEREIRRYLKANPRFGGRVVSCVGLRAEESNQRSKAVTWKFSKTNSKAGRNWWEWLPIHDMFEVEVFAMIAEAGEVPHWAYQAGMSRLSCAFCIMASKKDLRRAAQLRPALYAKYCETEVRIDQTFTMPVKGVRRFLPEVTGVSCR